MGINATQTIKHYDVRWFVWTIVFLLSTGVLLTTYITYVNLTDETLNLTDAGLRAKTVKQASTGK